MGGGQSKEEQLFQAVQNANHTAVKSLRRDGTSLEWTDKDGRTPLIMACTRGELFDMVITLLNLGASIKAFRPGSHGGYPLHHAAKRGLDKTVILLLSRGADPLALNDDGQTPLDMARNRGHVSVVRIIEDRICLFSGVLREISGPGFLEALAPQWVTRKIWAVVLPSAQGRRLPRNELVIYQSPKVSLPRIIIPLSKVQIEEPNFNLADAVMIITEKSSRTRFKFLSEFEGQRAQLEKFYRACKGIFLPTTTSNTSSPEESISPTRANRIPVSISAPSPHTPTIVSSPAATSPTKLSKEVDIPEDIALAMAINASIQSANEEGLVISPDVTEQLLPEVPVPVVTSPSRHDRRRGPLGRKYPDVLDGFWTSPEAGPSRVASVQNHTPQSWTVPVTGVDDIPVEIYVPSRPPPPPPPPPTTLRPRQSFGNTGFLRVGKNGTDEKLDDKMGGQCVVCWDAPARGVCIPCGHLAGCMNCLMEIKDKTWGCPVCRTTIQQVIKVFTV